MTEDEVRDRAKIILKFDEQEKDVVQGVGQLTTFNQLGIKGEGKDKKPDGWYLPKNKNDVAIILETKNSGENLGKKATVEEIKRNSQIVMDAGWQYVVGILYNGEKTAGFINNLELDIPKELQEKSFYFKLVTDKNINRHMIFLLTAKINNCLHTEFGITDLYHRMIFTAGALVAERYGAKLSGMRDRGYSLFHKTIIDTLENALQKDIQKNQKIKLLIDVYSNIQMNTTKNQDAINNFINWVIEISRSINSNRWRGEDVMGIFFNEFNRYKKKSSAGQIFTPDHITSFMYRLINVTKNDYVGDFACGSGAFLVKFKESIVRKRN